MPVGEHQQLAIALGERGQRGDQGAAPAGTLRSSSSCQALWDVSAAARSTSASERRCDRRWLARHFDAVLSTRSRAATLWS
jgi:hypothetical protein